MQKKTSPKQGQNNEFPIPRKEEALNSRALGGEYIPDFKDESPEGKTSKYPLQVSRPGERRI